MIFLDRFESQQTCCFNPIQRHKKPVESTLRPLTTCIEESKFCAQKLKRQFVQGWKLCYSCYVTIMSTETVDTIESDVEFLPVEIQRDSINASAKELGVSHLKVSKLGEKQRFPMGKENYHN